MLPFPEAFEPLDFPIDGLCILFDLFRWMLYFPSSIYAIAHAFLVNSLIILVYAS
jgi:hypothetical protein